MLDQEKTGKSSSNSTVTRLGTQGILEQEKECSPYPHQGGHLPPFKGRVLHERRLLLDKENIFQTHTVLDTWCYPCPCPSVPFPNRNST